MLDDDEDDDGWMGRDVENGDEDGDEDEGDKWE